MSGINSKLSGVIAGSILIFGVITDAFASQNDVGDTAQLVDGGKEIVQDVCGENVIVETETESIHTVYGVVQLRPDKPADKPTDKPADKSDVDKTETVTEQSTVSDKETASEGTFSEETAADETIPAVETVPTVGKVPGSVIEYNEEDYGNFLRIVEAEATGGDMKSKILVANVVINRVRSHAFPNTLTEVIFQENGLQFQPVMDGRFYSVTVSATTVEAVNRALAGEDYSLGATYFASLYAAGPGSWHAEHLIKLLEYGGHAFFTV